MSFSSFCFPSVILLSLLLCFYGQCHHFPQLQVPAPYLGFQLSSSRACLLSSKPVFPKCSLDMTPAKFYRLLALTYHKGNLITSSKLLLSLCSYFSKWLDPCPQCSAGILGISLISPPLHFSCPVLSNVVSPPLYITQIPCSFSIFSEVIWALPLASLMPIK